MSVLAKNTLYLTVASVAQKVLAFAYFVCLARVMNPGQTGDYFLALSITTIFSTVTDLGVTPVVIRESAKRPEEAGDLVRRALWLKIPFMALGALGAAGTAWALGYDAGVRELVLIASLVMLADAISLLFYGILRGFHALRYESLGIFVGQTCTLAIGGAVLLFHPSLPLLVLALLVGSAFNAAYSVWHVVRRLGPGVLVPRFSREETGAFVRAAVPFALAGIFVKVYSYVDSVFISKLLDVASVGIYAIAYKFTYSFQFLPMAFVAALYPGMSRMVGRDPEGLSRLFDDAMWYMALLGAPIAFGLWAVAPDAVALAGDGYAGAIPVLQTLIFVLIPIFLDFPVGSLLNAADRQGTKTAVMGATMLVNVAANALLIPRLGIVGAGWAGLVSFYFLLLAGLAFVPKIIPGYSFLRLARTLVPILVSAAAMGALARVLRPEVGFVPVVGISAVAYVALLFLFGAVRGTHVSAVLRLVRRTPPYAENAAPHD